MTNVLGSDWSVFQGFQFCKKKNIDAIDESYQKENKKDIKNFVC